MSVVPVGYIDTAQFGNFVRLARVGKIWRLVKLLRIARLFKLIKERNRIAKMMGFVIKIQGG
jgi:hypothetical protein